MRHDPRPHPPSVELPGAGAGGRVPDLRRTRLPARAGRRVAIVPGAGGAGLADGRSADAADVGGQLARPGHRPRRAPAAHERAAQSWRHPSSVVTPTEETSQASGRPARRSWVLFGLRWILAVGGLAWPLFLLMPRVDVPEWQPLAHFTIRRTTL